MSLPASTLDRLTIVYRKWVEEMLRSGEEENKWWKEAKALLGVASDELVALELVLKLGALNAAIWERQDALRALYMRGEQNDRDTFRASASALAFDLLKLNDWRAALVGEEKF